LNGSAITLRHSGANNFIDANFVTLGNAAVEFGGFSSTPFMSN
jgi:hypothetical protein